MSGALIAGRGLIGRALASRAGPGSVLSDHEGALRTDLTGLATVIWAGRSPRLGGPDWRIEDDLEPLMARRCAEAGVRFVSLSTRKVYAPSTLPLEESTSPGPTDPYGRQKLLIEQALRDVPCLDLLVLRLANIFGFEPGRRTFMGAMVDGLLHRGLIRFDMSPATRRDFLPLEDTAFAILALASIPGDRLPADRSVNLGSGVPLACGELAMALIEGFGQGRLEVTDKSVRDEFVMATARLHALLPAMRSDSALILEKARALGLLLRDERARRLRNP